MTMEEVMEEHLKAIQGDAALLAAETALLAKVATLAPLTRDREFKCSLT